MTEGILLRHASTDWNEAGRWQGGEVDRPLSAKGEISSTALAGHVREFFDTRPLVVTSPLVRAIQTGYRLAGDGPFEISADLRELGAGPLTGLRMEEIAERWPKFWRSWSQGDAITAPGGEAKEEAVARASRAVDRLVRLTTPWLAVTHMGLIRFMADSVLSAEDVPLDNLAGLKYSLGSWRVWSPPTIESRPRLRIVVGADSAGKTLLPAIRGWAAKRRFQVVELSQNALDLDNVNLTVAVARAIGNGEAELGILACGTGRDPAIRANSVRGIQVSAVSTNQEAQKAASSTDANILCLNGQAVTPRIAPQLLNTWIDTPFRADGSTRGLAPLGRTGVLKA